MLPSRRLLLLLGPVAPLCASCPPPVLVSLPAASLVPSCPLLREQEAQCDAAEPPSSPRDSSPLCAPSSTVITHFVFF